MPFWRANGPRLRIHRPSLARLRQRRISPDQSDNLQLAQRHEQAIPSRPSTLHKQSRATPLHGVDPPKHVCYEKALGDLGSEIVQRGEDLGSKHASNDEIGSYSVRVRTISIVDTFRCSSPSPSISVPILTSLIPSLPWKNRFLTTSTTSTAWLMD